MTTTSARRHRYSPLWRYLLFLVVIPYLVVSVTSGMQGRRAQMSPPELLASEERAGLPVSQKRVNDVMSPWLAARLQDIEAHKAYVDLSLELRDDRGKSTWGGEDDRLWSYYQDLGRSSTGAAHDAALWGLAYCEFRRGSSRRVVDLVASVQDQHLPYLELLLGASLHRLGEHARADSVLRAAIDAGRFPEFATEVMASSLLESHDWKRLEELRKDPRAGPHLPNRAIRALDLRRGAAWDYVVNLVRAQKVPAIPVLILLAIYACGVWFFLIRWWDAFEKEPWGTSLIAVFLGVASPVGIYVVHDFMNQFANPGVTGVPPLDFLYYVVIVGFVEECVKIAPVFLLGWLGARQMNERSDWMIYGCLSALGFSLNENYGYLLGYGLKVGVARFFLSTPLHVSLTGCLALTLRRIYLREPQGWRRFAVALASVALIHGTFDFLLGLRNPEAWFAAVVLGPLWGLVFLKIFGKVVSTSPFRSNPARHQASCTSWFMGAFVALCLFNYLAAARILGAEAVIPKLQTDLIGAQFFLLLGLVYSRLDFAPMEGALLKDRGPAARREIPRPSSIGSEVDT